MVCSMNVLFEISIGELETLKYNVDALQEELNKLHRSGKDYEAYTDNEHTLHSAIVAYLNLARSIIQ